MFLDLVQKRAEKCKYKVSCITYGEMLELITVD